MNLFSIGRSVQRSSNKHISEELLTCSCFIKIVLESRKFFAFDLRITNYDFPICLAVQTIEKLKNGANSCSIVPTPWNILIGTSVWIGVFESEIRTRVSAYSSQSVYEIEAWQKNDSTHSAITAYPNTYKSFRHFPQRTGGSS